MLKGWEGSKEKLGAACCHAGFSHHREPTEGFAAEHLRLCPASHLSTLPLSPHLGAVFFQFSVTKKNARDAVHLLTQKLNFWGVLSNPCKCPKSVDFQQDLHSQSVLGGDS